MVLYLSHLHEESKRRLIIISLVRSVKTQTYSSFYAIYKRLHLSNKSKVAQTTPSSQPKILTLPIALNNLFLSIRWSFCICHGSGVSTRLKKKSFICHAKKVNERREPVTRSVYQSPDTYEYINVMERSGASFIGRVRYLEESYVRRVNPNLRSLELRQTDVSVDSVRAPS